MSVVSVAKHILVQNAWL